MEFNFRFHVSPISIGVHHHQSSEFGELKALMVRLAASLQTFQGNIMATQDAILAQLAAMTTEVGNIATAVAALIAAQGAAGSTTPAEDAAVAALQTALDGLRDAASPPAP